MGSGLSRNRRVVSALVCSPLPQGKEVSIPAVRASRHALLKTERTSSTASGCRGVLWLQQREHSHEILDFGVSRCRYAFRRCNGERTHRRTGFPGRRRACDDARPAKFRGGDQTGDGADKRPAKAGRRWGRAKRNAPTSQKGQAQTPAYVKRNRKLIFLSFVYGRHRHSISNFYAVCVTLAPEPSTQLRDVHLVI